MELAPRSALPSRPDHSRTSLRLRASQIEFLEVFSARVRRDTGRFLGMAAVVDTLVAATPEERILSRSARSESGKRDDPIRTFPIQLRNETLAKLKMLAASIRRQTGAVTTMSAIVRPLVDWLDGVAIDTSAINSLADLEVFLARRLRDE